jgi:transcriptional regulator with XRE-family HTH domain
MTPDELKSARYQLGMTQRQLAEALELGKDGSRAVRRWEKNERPISGPVAVAVRLMLERAGDRGFTLSRRNP